MKPENIFLVDSGGGKFLAKILDFGISKIRHSKTALTKENSLMGTAYFMSPEQARGAVGSVDHTTDIFALGAIMYRALTGEYPFDAPTLLGVLNQVCTGTPAPMTKLVPDLPPGLEAVVLKALAKEKAERSRA